MARKVLITGGAGFIGSHLADELLSRGDQVEVLAAYTRTHDVGTAGLMEALADNPIDRRVVAWAAADAGEPGHRQVHRWMAGEPAVPTALRPVAEGSVA